MRLASTLPTVLFWKLIVSAQNENFLNFKFLELEKSLIKIRKVCATNLTKRPTYKTLDKLK